MNFSYDSVNSAKMYDVMAKAENLQREMKLQKDILISNMANDIEEQKMSQEEMSKALFELVKIQNESNKIIQNQCDELKRQNDLLQRQNIQQAKDLKKQKIWNWITYGITTAIALASVIGTFIGLFR